MNAYLALKNWQVWKKCSLIIERNRIISERKLCLGIRIATDSVKSKKYFNYFHYFDVKDHPICLAYFPAITDIKTYFVFVIVFGFLLNFFVFF